MTNILTLLAKPLALSSWPSLPCPICLMGHFVSSGPVLYENAESIQALSHAEWEPLWISGIFTWSGECGNPKCKQVMRALGTYFMDFGDDVEYEEFLKVEYILPPLLLLPLPDGTPASVTEAVSEAERVLFAAPGLAATALRSAVEAYLDSVEIPRVDDKGRRLTLHGRLLIWRSSPDGDNEVYELLNAIKWIGNQGAHERKTLGVEQVLSGVEFLEESFRRLITGPRLQARAKEINETKGNQSR